MTGSHHAGNVGIRNYVRDNKAALQANAIAGIEIEHLGALDVAPDANGNYQPTGSNSPYIVAVSAGNDALVNAAKTWAKSMKPTIVAGPDALGFGAGGPFWASVTHAVQLVSGPQYLLSYDFPNQEVVKKFVDYDLLRTQAAATARMIDDLTADYRDGRIAPRASAQ